MNSNDKRMIDQLIRQLRKMEDESAAYDQESADYIESQIRQHPSAPYYMAQLLLLQKESLANAKSEIQQLRNQDTADWQSQNREPANDQGPSFLAGAAQAALAVGGGLLLAEFVGDLLGEAFGEDSYQQFDGVTDSQFAADSGDIGESFDLFGGDGDWGDFFG